MRFVSLLLAWLSGSWLAALTLLAGIWRRLARCGARLWAGAHAIWTLMCGELLRWRTQVPRIVSWSQAKSRAFAAYYRVQTPLRKALIAFMLFLTLLTGPAGAVLTLTDLGSRLLANFSPNETTVDPTHSVIHLPPAPPVTTNVRTTRPLMPHTFAPTPQEVVADPAGVTFFSEDKRFEIDVPAGAVTAQDLANVAGHQEKLRVTQLAPASGATAGGSGLISFGMYLVELVDGNGNRVKHGFHKPVRVLLHYAPQERAFNLEHAFVVFNGAHPKSVKGLGASSSQPLVLDRVKQTLGTQIPADPTLANVAGVTFKSPGNAAPAVQELAYTFSSTTSSTSSSANAWGLSFNSTTPVAKFVNPDPLNVDLPSGSLTDAIPLDLPAGPAGNTPPLQLTYNSGAVSEQHNPQGAAGWVGEGWNLNLGAITWSERDYTSRCSNCTQIWQNQWFLNDPFGTSTELLPPATNTSTYYDDSPYAYCATGNTSSTPCPIQFHTASESYAKIYAYVGGNNYGNANGLHTLCFRVYLTNGIMEEFGCSLDSVHYDSLQYYVSQGTCPGGCLSGYYFPSAYFPDLITYPTGDQIHITYQSDWEQTSTGDWYPRDTVLKTIEWDSPDCINASQACTGSWHPHFRVQFNASHTPARLTNTPTNCNTSANVRCDDPLNLTGSNTIPAPQINSTFVLNDLAVQTNMSGNGGAYNSSAWNTVRDYQLGYEQSGPTTITDPVTGSQQSVAGYLDLTRIQEVGTDGNAANGSPITTFGYTSNNTTEYYEDGTFTPPSSVGCGPSWNTGGNGNPCDLWDQSYASNSRYIASVDNHLGQIQTVTWANARSNTHGVNSGGSAFDPLYCNSHQSGYPCDEADDQQWSRAVVTARDRSVLQVTQNGQGGAQNSQTLTGQYQYTYQLAQLQAQECGDCIAGFYWGDQNNADYLDFYNPHFMGFAQTSISKPDGSLETHKFYSTEGWGIYNPDDTGNPPYEGTGFAATNTSAQDGSIYQDIPQTINPGDQYCADAHVVTQGTGSGASGIMTIWLTGGTSENAGQSYSNLPGGNTWTPLHACVTATAPHTAVRIQFYPTPGSPTTAVDGVWVSHNLTLNGGFNGTSANWGTLVAGTNFVVYNPGAPYCTSNLPPYSSCHESRWSDLGNAAHGLAYEVDYYETDGTTLLRKVTNQYAAVCPPSGGATSWHGMQASELDNQSNPVLGCDVQLQQTATVNRDGATSDNAAPSSTVSYTHDSYGRVTKTVTTNVNGGSVSGSPQQLTHSTTYIQNDGLALPPAQQNNTIQEGAWGGLYLMDTVAASEDFDSSGNKVGCAYTSYDGAGYATGQQGTLSHGNPTQTDSYTACASSGGKLSVKASFDAFGNQATTTDANGNMGCATNGVSATTCTTFGTVTLAQPTSVANALNQMSSTGYDTSAAGGFGLWPVSSTDPNNQTTSTTYDTLGRVATIRLPGQTTGAPSSQMTYTYFPSCSGAQTVCYEVDAATRTDSGTQVTQRAFYDGTFRLVETRTPAPGGMDSVTYTLYDVSGKVSQASTPYLVTAYTGAPGPSAYTIPDSSVPSTHYRYDGLGRTTTVTDPLGHQSSMSYETVCNAAGTNDPACYSETLTIDADVHQQTSLADGLGRVIYTQDFTGNSSASYALYRTVKTTYDAMGRTVAILHPDGAHSTTFTYDTAGRLRAMSDPDRGHESYSYDPNGNLTASVDARGASGTIYAGYDGLNRQLWRNTTNSASGAYVTYGYDSTANGNVGVGRLTSETFSNANAGGTLAGSYAYTYDALGRVTATTETLGATPYTTSATYNDAGQLLSQTYPNGDVLTTSYDALSGWQDQQSVQLSGAPSALPLLTSEVYAGAAGAMGLLTGATLGGFSGGATGSYSASYDALGRLTDSHYTLTPSGGATTSLYEVQPTYDALGNAIETVTTLPQGVDTQVFCYDDLSRLTWAGSSGTPNCSGAPTPSDTGSLAGTGAQYSASYSYDNLNRQTSSPLGSYTYGDSAHADTATAIGSGSSAWTASYDASGNMTCRAASGATTCSGATPTGAQLAYDNQGQLAQWLSAPTNPTSSASYLYDGEGHRAQQVATTSGTTTTTSYIGSLEEVTSDGTTTTTTAYYGALALSVNGALSYTLTDGLGSVSESVSASSGVVSATQLYGPYGAVRYQNGALPTSYGYTHQRSDAVSGLDYYNARYYDPLAGQFTSADPLSSMGISTLVYRGQAPASPSTPDGAAQRPDPPHDGLNAYSYVKGNPETFTDPTGLWTFGICVSVGVGVGMGGFLAGCVVIAQSDDGQWTGGLTGTYGGGVSAGDEATAGVGFQVSNAQHVGDLRGPFHYAGGTAADEVGFGATGFTGQDSQGRQVNGADVQLVAGAGAAGYGGMSNTGVLESKGPNIQMSPAQQWYRATHGPAGPVSTPFLHAWDETTQGFGRYRRPAVQVFDRFRDGWSHLKERYVPDPGQVWPNIAPWVPPTRWLH